jgi:hypothetical protein
MWTTEGSTESAENIVVVDLALREHDAGAGLFGHHASDRTGEDHEHGDRAQQHDKGRTEGNESSHRFTPGPPTRARI